VRRPRACREPLPGTRSGAARRTGLLVRGLAAVVWPGHLGAGACRQRRPQRCPVAACPPAVTPVGPKGAP